MSGYIVHEETEMISLPCEAVERLVRCGSGDAALLYLELQRHTGSVTAQSLQHRLRWSQLRLRTAESELRKAGLLQGETPPAPEMAEERPSYTAADLSEMLQGDGDFKMLIGAVEEKLGKRLKTADLQILAGLYDDVGLPTDVIYLLVSHCTARIQRRYGQGRRPTMRQVEKEGYYWARLGLFDQDSAGKYLQSCARQDEEMGQYMRALGLGDRRAVESEEKYLRAWMDWGFTPDAVAMAYDKTVFYKKELNWRYLNGILRRWHDQGWHTAEDVQQGDRPKAAQQMSDQSDMDQYMNW